MKTPSSFDIMKAANLAYKRVWDERPYLVKLAAVPAFVRFACFVTIISLNLTDNQFRATLFLLPAFFTEGWMMAHWVRLIFLGQRWPFQPSGDDEKDLIALDDRARGILSGMVFFVLLQMIVGGIIALGSMYPVSEEQLQNPDAMMRVGSIALLVFMFWSFRFLWISIPLALNYPVMGFIKRTSHPKISFYLIAVWVISALPGFCLMLFITLPIITSESSDISLYTKMTAAALHVCLELILSLLTTAAISYGLKEIFSRKESDTPA